MNNFDFINSIKINSCGISDCSADWRWDTGENGFHDFDFWFVVRGKGRMTSNNETVSVLPGSCLLLFPRTHYIGEHDVSSPLMTMNVHFSLPENLSSEIYADRTSLTCLCISDPAYLSGILQRVIYLYNSGNFSLSETVFCSALAEYFTQNCISPKSKAKKEYGGNKNLILKKMCDAVNTSPENTPSLAQFAKEYGYSTDYLGKIFSSGVGISFSEYTANARINKAKLLLSSTSLSLEEISENLGYYDTCHFSKQFKRITGISPGKYKRHM